MNNNIVSIDEFFASMTEEERAGYEKASKVKRDPYESWLFCLWKNHQIIDRLRPRKGEGMTNKKYNRYCKINKIS